ncbi:unannotated protein [freshwater metagenome]|uniref:Unannotated protein n=1 Tax=freshwater metagenome TaxID=449393 RepID=A0A6J7IRY7_9ZZZZ
MSRSWMARERLQSPPPMSRTVVNPQSSAWPSMRTACAVRYGASARSILAGETWLAYAWTWRSMSPGMRVRPRTSMRRAPGATMGPSETSVMRSPVTSTESPSPSMSTPSNTRAFSRRIPLIPRPSAVDPLSRRTPHVGNASWGILQRLFGRRGGVGRGSASGRALRLLVGIFVRELCCVWTVSTSPDRRKTRSTSGAARGCTAPASPSRLSDSLAPRGKPPHVGGEGGGSTVGSMVRLSQRCPCSARAVSCCMRA